LLKLTSFEYISVIDDPELTKIVNATLNDTDNVDVRITAAVPVPKTLRDVDAIESFLRDWFRKIDVSNI